MRPNTLLIRHAKGWAERQASGDASATGRREALLTLGALSSLGEVERTADGQLDEFARERIETTVGVEPSGPDDTPYLAFDVGDTITLEGEEHRVLGMTVSRDPQTGRAIFVPALNDDVVLTPEERMAQLLRQLLVGGLGGRSKVAQPVAASRRTTGGTSRSNPGSLSRLAAISVAVAYTTADQAGEIDFTDVTPDELVGGDIDLGGSSFSESAPTLRFVRAGVYSVSATAFWNPNGSLGDDQGDFRALQVIPSGSPAANSELISLNSIAAPVVYNQIGGQNTVVSLSFTYYFDAGTALTFTIADGFSSAPTSAPLFSGFSLLAQRLA